MDGHNNILINECFGDNTKVFSQEGDLLHVIIRKADINYGITAHKNNIIHIIDYNLEKFSFINSAPTNKYHYHLYCLRDNLYTVYNGYSDILDIVILLSLSIFPHLHIRYTKFIGYSDIMVIVIIWQ